jgi:aspartyl-tRNA(Asn)/glutamyl-tRNA(Gln) amidotransferase subunit B
MMEWETVIGLEVHVQLATASKLFCGCSTSFGDDPNTNVCPVCLGLPGALPVLNAEAVRLGVRAAHALGATIRLESVFARKNYFYPDLPKGYQISQFDRPLAEGGCVRITSPERGATDIPVTRLHLEEDAGKSLHDRFPGKTAVDLNRAGVPLAEIVSGPDLRSPAEARAYLTTLRQRLVYAGVSECSMEKGSLRVDANISLRPRGATTLGTKAEVKNMNSFANAERALEAERERQLGLLSRGEPVEQVTLLFDAATGTVRPMRSKEESRDYRYFADPDLPPLRVTAEWVEAERARLPELPDAKRARLAAEHGLTPYDAEVLAAESAVADYYEAVVAAGADAKVAANWVTGEALAALKEDGGFALTPARLAELAALVGDGTLSLQAAKKVFAELRHSTERPFDAARRLNLVQVRDRGALDGWVAEALAGNPDEVERYRAGEQRLLGFFVGQVMKRSGGKADPKAVQAVITEKLK